MRKAKIVRARQFLFLLSSLVLCSGIGFGASLDLVQKAKQEGGEVITYDTTRIAITRPLFDAFEAKYPFLKVKQYKADTNKMMQRVLAEYRAGKHLVDVLSFGNFHMEVLIDKGIVGQYESPERRNYAPLFKDKRGGYWTAVHYIPMTIDYNTNLVSEKVRPQEWQDLVDPKWKGQIAMEEDNVEWYAGMLKGMGTETAEKFMKALAKQNIRLTRGPSDGIALLAAGEFSILISRGQHAEALKAKGAPVDWVKNPNPLVSQFKMVSIPQRPPHPNSAKLFIDFMLSDTAAEIFAKFLVNPAREGVRNISSGFKEIDIKKLVPPPTEELKQHYSRYLKEFRDLFGAL
ncbi:MAG: extracellular solute-binding protein [Candidatus Binatia bacterium]